MTTAPRCLLLSLAVAAACSTPPRDPLEELRVGRFVEAKGDFTTGRALVREIDAVERGADDKADKVEVTGPVERAEGSVLQVVGSTFTVDGETAFENADKQTVARFTPAAGDWLRLKARDKGEDGLRARTVRAATPREQFKVTGEVRAVDRDAGTLDIGGVRLPVAQDVDLELPGRRDPNDPLSLFMADDQKAVPFTIRVGDSVRLGGQAAAELEWDDEFDLDGSRDRDRTKPAVRGKLDALWLLDDRGSYALGEVSFGRDDVIRQGGEDTHDETLEVTRALVSLRASDELQLLAGRQDFDEEREWLYDEVLDGVRAVWRQDQLELELGFATGRELGAEDNEYEDTGLWVGHVRWHLDPTWHVGAYALQRTDDTAAGFEPLLVGLRSIATPRFGLGHWAEFGLARGDDGARDVDGFAFDVGVLHTFDVAGRPSLGAGIAHGSGERDGGQQVGYRQSGLQDNNGKLGGVTSVRYYGELLDPELANLTVTTLCAAVRPIRGGSVSLLLHTYRQDVASTTFPATELRVAPTGGQRDLGHEIDLVFGYRLERRLTLELVLARFEPGEAFAGDTAANLVAITSRLSF